MNRLQPTARGVRIKDRIAAISFRGAAYSVFGIVGLILWMLLGNSLVFLSETSFVDFLTGNRWIVTSTESSNAYGIMAPLSGTLMVAIGAPLLAVPFGLAGAIYLAEYAKPKVRAIVKPTLEILTGIPSIVMGFFAFQVINPWVRSITEPGDALYYLSGGNTAEQYNMLSAIIAVAIMILPIIVTFSEDAIRAVPKHLKEASMGLGATKWETTRKVVFPAAISGITASIVLAVARAIGETMAVTMAAGTAQYVNYNPFAGALTATSAIANTAANDIAHDGPAYSSLFMVGLVLFLLTLIMNMVAQRFVKRFREVE